MHCAGQHKPYAEWHKPCRYYRLLFRNLQALPQIPATVFCGFPPVLTTSLPALLPMAYAADFRGWFSATLIAAPSAFCCWLPLLFPSADPSRLRRRPIGIFTGFLSAGLYQEPPPRSSPRVLWKRSCRRLPHFWGACAFYLLSMVSLHTKTSFLTKPHGSKLSLSSFCGLSHGTGQPLP